MSYSNEISVSSLLPMIGTPDCPTLIDVCIDEDYTQNPVLIPGAFRQPHTAIEDLFPVLEGRSAVVICQKGLKLSHGAAAMLRAEGIDARVLIGGITAWCSADKAPVVPGSMQATTWVLADTAALETASVRWLIERWIAPGARILRVPSPTVAEVAAKFGARPAWSDLAEALSALGLKVAALHDLVEALQQKQNADHHGLQTALSGAARMTCGRDKAELAILDATYAALCARSLTMEAA